MKRNVFKLGALVIALVMVMNIFTACGSVKEESTPTVSTAAVTSTVAAETKTADATPVTLKWLFLNEWKDSTGKNVTKTLEGFTKENPNITVELEMVPAGEEEKKILLNHASGGSEYDMFFINHISTGMLAKAGAIADITDLSTAAGLDINTFNDALKTTCYSDGKLYAIPFESDCRLMSYNKKMFADAKIEVPKTVDEFMAAAKALTKDGKYGFAQPFTSWSIAYELTELFYGDGGSLLIKDGDKYKANFNTPEGATFIKRMKELKNYMPKDFISMDYDKVKAAFLDGKVAMRVDGPWMLGDPTYQNAKIEIGTFPIPAGTVKSASVIGGWLYGISAGSKNKEATMKVIAYISKPEINGATQNGLSPVKEAYNFAPMNDAKYAPFKEQMDSAVVVFPEGYELANQTVETYFKEFSKALLLNGSPEDGAKAINDAIQKTIDTGK